MNYREQRAYQNCEKRIFEGVGEYDMPVIRDDDVDLTGAEILGFNYALNEKHPENKIVHFFLDDYQFERVWAMPDRYLDLLGKFRAVLSPDFSMYTDFPLMVNMFNHYRNQWLGAYWQSYGIHVIPTLGWIDDKSYSWCFDGVPENSTVCISTIGCWRNPNARKLFLAGWEKAKEVLRPSRLLLVGKQFPGITFDGEITAMQSPNLREKENKSVRRT